MYNFNLNILLLFILNLLQINDSYQIQLHTIKKAIDYNRDIFITLFVKFGECDKCVKMPMIAYNCAINKLKDQKINLNPKIIAIVRCSRELELKRFTKLYSWNSHIMIDKGDVLNNLNLPENTRLAIFNKDSCIKFWYSESQFDCDSLFIILLKLTNNKG